MSQDQGLARSARTKIRQNSQARLDLRLRLGRVGDARPDQGEPRPPRARARQTGLVKDRARPEQIQSRIEPSKVSVFQPDSGIVGTRRDQS